MQSSLVQNALKFREQGNNPEAVKLFKQHLIQFPKDLYTLHNLAAALGDLGDYFDSAKYAKQALEFGLDKAQTWLVYARALAGLQSFDEAESAYLKVIKSDPYNYDAYKELAQLTWMLSADIDKALAYFNLALLPIDKAINLHILRADLASQMGDHQLQYDYMLKCFEQSNRLPAAQFYLSKAALNTKRYEEALRRAQDASQYFANDIQCNIHLINCLLANGKTETALSIVRQIRKHKPLDQHLIALEGICLRQLGDPSYATRFNYKNLVQQLPLGVPNGWETLEQYIADLENELDAEHKFNTHPFYQSVRHGSQLASITASRKPAMSAFKSAVERPLNKYLDSIKKFDLEFSKRNVSGAKLHSAWSVKLFSDGFHTNHVHQEGWISSACHIRLLNQDSTTKDGKAGWIKFGEPGPYCSPPLEAEHIVEPKRGHIVFFPSYFWHGTIPFNSNEERLTVAADFVPK